MTMTTKISTEFMNGSFRIVGMEKWDLLALVRFLNMLKGDADKPTQDIINAILDSAGNLGITPKTEGK